MTVSELLTASRQSHRHGLTAKSKRQTDIAAMHLSSASEQRQAAHDADPDHTDPAWLDDAKNANGQVMRDRSRTIEQVAREIHDALMAYYAPLPLIVAPRPTVADVVVPKGMKRKETLAFQQLKRELDEDDGA